MQIYSIRVDKKKARTINKKYPLPFRTIYLVPPDATPEQIKSIVPYSVVTDLLDSYAEYLKSENIPFGELKQQCYKVVIPLRMSRQGKKSGYLRTDELQFAFGQNAQKKAATFLPDYSAILMAPGMIPGNICDACPNVMAHVCGECYLGGYVCTQKFQLDLVPLKLGNSAGCLVDTEADRDELDRALKGDEITT